MTKTNTRLRILFSIQLLATTVLNSDVLSDRGTTFGPHPAESPDVSKVFNLREGATRDLLGGFTKHNIRIRLDFSSK